jgi:hypothetical protein
MLRFQTPGLRVNSALPSSLPLLLFFLPFTWGRHPRVRATTALPRATSLELLILFDRTCTVRDFVRSFLRHLLS